MEPFQIVYTALRIPWEATRWREADLTYEIVVECDRHWAGIDAIPRYIHLVGTDVGIPELRNRLIEGGGVKSETT